MKQLLILGMVLCLFVSVAFAQEEPQTSAILTTEVSDYQQVTDFVVFISPAQCKDPDLQLTLSHDETVEMKVRQDYLVVRLDREMKEVGKKTVPIIKKEEPEKHELDRVFNPRKPYSSPPNYHIEVILHVYAIDDTEEKFPQSLPLKVDFHSYRSGNLPTGHMHNADEAFVVKLPKRRTSIKVKLSSINIVNN